MRFPIMLGPEFANLLDDTEESLLGSAGHQSAISTLYSGRPICAQRRGLPWFVATKLALLILQTDRDLPGSHALLRPNVYRCRDVRLARTGE
jgi:hypothetical protein